MNKAIIDDIYREETTYNNDVAADGRFVAEGKRRLREESDELFQNMETKQGKKSLKEILNTQGFYAEDEETGNILYYMIETDKDENPTIDRENKRVKFIDAPSGKFFFEEYIEDEEKTVEKK